MRRIVQYTALALGIGLAPAGVSAGEVVATAVGGVFGVPVTSMRELRTARVVMQQYDFSCGAAAVATLLSFHYNRPTPEQAIFKTMYDRGDQATIRERGFSMLDMKAYLESLGFHADGFRLKLDRLKAIGVPVVTLVDINGYKHFVVVKGMEDGRVLVGDPAYGASVMEEEYFGKIWSGTVLAIRDRPQEARKQFNQQVDWKVRPRAPVGRGLPRDGISAFTRYLPSQNNF
jgi:predicted double-glycine peptidase